MLVWKKVLLTLLLSLIAGCGGVKKEPETAGPVGKGPVTGLPGNSGGLRAEVIEGQEPQAFRIRVSWTAGGSWRLLRESDRRPREALGLVESATEYVDDSPMPGERLRYLLVDGEAEAAQRLSAEVTVPRDLEITGTRVLRSITGVHRLFLRTGAVLVGEDGQLEIQVDEIHSQGATIAAFPPGATAAAGQPGRTGRHVVLKAQRGSGVVHVLGNGESGSPGSTGLPGNVGAAGREGRRYATDLFAVAVQQAEVFRESRTAVIGGTNASNVRPRRLPCADAPGPGSPGVAGGKGGGGGTGTRGGDATKIYVRLQHPAGIEIRPVSLPGTGGAGGLGGPGGAGGAGGAPGELDPDRMCPEAARGANGETGPIGEAGLAGPHGAAAPICLKLGPAVHGDCAAFPEIPPFTD